MRCCPPLPLIATLVTLCGQQWLVVHRADFCDLCEPWLSAVARARNSPVCVMTWECRQVLLG